MKKSLFFPVLLSLLFSNCATNKFEKPAKPNISQNSLIPQTLAKDECGIFLWTVNLPRSFVFFQRSGDDYALPYAQNKQRHLQVSYMFPDWHIANDVNMSYQSGNDKVQVLGTFSQKLDSGRRIEQATIVITQQNGWQEIIPVLGVYGCSESANFKPN